MNCNSCDVYVRDGTHDASDMAVIDQKIGGGFRGDPSRTLIVTWKGLKAYYPFPSTVDRVCLLFRVFSVVQNI